MAASTTPSRLRHCLNDVDYPADKDALLGAAARNGCDDETSRALRAIPPEIYANLSEVMASVTLGDDDLSDAEKAEAHRVHTKPGLAQKRQGYPAGQPDYRRVGRKPGFLSH
jgi:Protein of unknown function (DUF2795)